MLAFEKAKNTLVPFVSAVFLGVTVAPVNSAVSTDPTVIPSGPPQSIFIDQSEPAIQGEQPIILVFGGAATSAITNPLSGAARECQSVGAEYAASCAAAAFKKAARAASRPDYRDAKRELNNAARKLDRLVSQNADRSAPSKRGKNGNYKAVKKEAVAQVRREALKIIQETETKLIRSAGSGQRKVHYQRIAQAVGSTKVIFRS